MIKKLFDYLKTAELDTYLPAKKTGKCTHPYTVIDEEKSEIGLTGRCVYAYYTVTVVSPIDNFSLLEETVSKVKAALKEAPFRFDGSSSTTIDENTGGYYRVLNYHAIKPISCKN